ncbi:MAG: acyltransferase [Comamonadaceae bacterium]|nr:acyltransferase [Comamonadaceae bacterium]
MGLEFLAGALLAHAYECRARIFQTTTPTVALCLVLMVCGLVLGMTSPYFDRVEIMRAASFGVMGLSALVLALTLEHTRFVPPAWLVAVGNASYSLYLLHTFLLDTSGRVRYWLDITSPIALLLFLLALPVAIVFASLLRFRYVEKPIMKAAL